MKSFAAAPRIAGAVDVEAFDGFVDAADDFGGQRHKMAICARIAAPRASPNERI